MSDAREYPHCQAAFINAIREEGTKTEACDWLQKTWNELCAVRKELDSAYLQGRKDMREEAARLADADRGLGDGVQLAVSLHPERIEASKRIATAIRSIDVKEPTESVI